MNSFVLQEVFRVLSEGVNYFDFLRRPLSEQKRLWKRAARFPDNVGSTNQTLCGHIRQIEVHARE